MNLFYWDILMVFVGNKKDKILAETFSTNDTFIRPNGKIHISYKVDGTFPLIANSLPDSDRCDGCSSLQICRLALLRLFLVSVRFLTM